MSGRVVVAGALARRARYGGHAWALVQWALAFRRRGWDVLWLDALEPEGPRERTGAATGRHTPEVQAFRDLMGTFDLADGSALRVGKTWIGRSAEEVLSFARGADLLVNVMGYLTDPELLAAPARRVFLDIDPGFGQMWCDLGLCDLFDGHDDFVTVGLNVGRDDCVIPSCGLSWIPTLPPVVLEHWPRIDRPGEGFRAIGSWRGPFEPIDFRGRRYGLRVHQFRRFLELPRRTGHAFEMALDIHPADARDLERLDAAGWILVDPDEVAGDPGSYRRYIQGSAAEFLVAKDLYVRSRSGWFSDRSACFLASGRPVLAQDTGLPDWLPTGEGLVVFDTVEEAAAGAEAIVEDPGRHGRVARAIAEAYLDSDRVLERLLSRLGPGPSVARSRATERGLSSGERVGAP